MRVDINTVYEEKIEYGDVVVTESGIICFVVKTKSAISGFDTRLVDVATLNDLNGFQSLESLNKARYLYDNDPIVKVIKSNTLKLIVEG